MNFGFYCIFLDTYYVNLAKYLHRVSLEVSINWHYLYQDGGKAYSEISNMRSHWKYSKATIWRQMKKNIGDLVVKKNQGRPPKLSFRQKGNILRQNKHLFVRRDAKCLCEQTVMVKAGIPPSISKETVCRVLRKTDQPQTDSISEESSPDQK